MAAPELKTLGRYNIERVLGKGAMGVVYEGVDPRLGRRVAIKTILKSHLDEDTAKDYSMRFVREAQAVARLNHPNIVQVYDFGEEGDIAYLVMEFIRGKELKNFFDANERFDLKEAVRVMCELCDALDFAHQHGIIHRDIKPANVMLDHQARTKLTDFGVARVTDSDKTSVERTQAGTMVGTPAYMSPEQITGGNIDRRTDVFSAGIILYQFLTGEKPFTGSGAWTIAKKIIQEEPPLPSSLNNAVTPLFDSLVNKALAKNPDHRFQSARDLAVALRRALEGKSEEDDADKTIVGALSEPVAPAARSSTSTRALEGTRGGATGSGAAQTGSQEIELEFWRAIKDGNDPEDFELYVQQFPTGIYAALAKRKIAKLRGVAPEETGAKAKEQEKKEAEEAASREAEVRAKLAAEKAQLEAELKRKEEEYRKREAEAEAKRLAAEKARAEAEEKARKESEEKARQAAEKAKQEAAAERERARLEAEKAKQEAERAKQEALAAARAEADKERERARLEAEKAKREAEARAKKDAEERAKREAEFKKREAELRAQAAAGGRKSSPAVPVAVGAIVLALAGAGYYFLPQQDPQATAKLQAMQRQLEEAKQKAAELEAQKQKEEQARLALEKARKAEEDARKVGDLKRQQELAQARVQAEAEAKREADTTKLREAEAKKTADAAEAARRQAEAKKQVEAKAAEERALSDKLAKERAAVEAERQRLAAEKAAAERAAAEARAATEKAAAERAAAEKAKLAAVSAVPTAPSSDGLLKQAEGLEEQGNGKEAVKAYTRAARAGNGRAAKRLGEIYDKGLVGIPRDYAESLKWYNAARVLGEEVPLARGR
jgi:serine/threonine-protein kinase